jgi:hypothetical protein
MSRYNNRFDDPDLTTPEHDSILFWLREHILEVIHTISPTWVDVAPQQQGILEKAIMEAERDHQQDLEGLDHARKIKLDEEDAVRRGTRPAYFWGEKRIEEETKKCAASQQRLADYQQKLERLGAREIEIPETITLRQSEHPLGSYAIDLFVQTKRLEPWFQEPRPGMPWEVEPRFAENDYFYYFEVKPRILSFGELMRQLRRYEVATHSHRWTRHIAVVSPDSRFAEAVREEGFPFIQIQHLASGDWRLDSCPSNVTCCAPASAN